MTGKGHTGEGHPVYKRKYLLYVFCICAAFFIGVYPSLRVKGAEPVKVEFFYENVCASCDGDADFYDLFHKCITAEEKEALNTEISTYNVFLDSCKEYYEDTAKRLDIPKETSLPVLVVGDQWMSGYGQMKESLRSVLLGQGTVDAQNRDREQTENKKEKAGGDKEQTENKKVKDQLDGLDIEFLIQEVRKKETPVLLLFTTAACEDCEQVKKWLSENRETVTGGILEYNIIEDNCLAVLKCMFEEYGIEEKDQKVPILFYGDQAFAGKGAITEQDFTKLTEEQGNALLKKLKNVKKQLNREENANDQEEGNFKLLTLAAAGLLAGLNPCSISMLLMLLSLILSGKNSVLKNGLLYLGGKYTAYFSIGLLIYLSAAQIDRQVLEGAGRVMNGILVVLFAAAGTLYLVDAFRIRRQEYGKIRTQLPVGLRRWNHRLIQRVSGYSGFLQPVMILGLGIAISLGEFFCTGQIYMASITYLLKERASGIWLPFLVYVTAMSLPAFLMIILIQKTRNTEHISEFMLRHLGAVKLFNAMLFFGFVIYFLFY